MNYSIREVALMIIDLLKDYEEYREAAEQVQLVDVDSRDYYGAAYQDIAHRVPSIKEAEEHLGWRPSTDVRTALRLTLDYHLRNRNYELNKLQTR
jgi:nucleoside-diphosphate-sugar epimerase